MTLAHRAVGDIRRGGFRQLRNYVDMCSSLAKRPQQKDFFAYAQKALQRTDSCYYSLVHNLLDTADEDRLCTVGCRRYPPRSRGRWWRYEPWGWPG